LWRTQIESRSTNGFAELHHQITELKDQLKGLRARLELLEREPAS
jgi:hypothetical protein